MAIDLFKHTAQEVRNSEPLMAVYIELYEDAFGVKPNCVPCTFSNDFIRLKNYLTVKNKPMANKEKAPKTFELKKINHRIYSYIDASGKKRPMYDTNMTEEFAIAFLTNGTQEELTERTQLFNKLPFALTQPKKETTKKVKKNVSTSKSNVGGDLEKGGKTKKRRKA